MCPSRGESFTLRQLPAKHRHRPRTQLKRAMHAGLRRCAIDARDPRLAHAQRAALGVEVRHRECDLFRGPKAREEADLFVVGLRLAPVLAECGDQRLGLVDPEGIEFPLMLGGEPIRLTAYPVEAAIAEKFHVMVVRDLRNSRMKDFYDIWTLSRNCAFARDQLRGAIRSTFERRGTPLPRETPAALTAAFHTDPDHAQQWRAFSNRINEAGLAESLDSVVADIAAFIMPAVHARVPEESELVWQAGPPWRAP